MTYFLLFLSMFFILLSTYGFYYSTEKVRKKDLNSRLNKLIISPKIIKLVSSLLFILAFLTLSYIYDYSIAFVSIWILYTPIFLLVILLKNNLKAIPKKE